MEFVVYIVIEPVRCLPGAGRDSATVFLCCGSARWG